MNYDTWHSHLPVDDEIDTLWHRKVIDLLRPSEDIGGREVLEIGCGRGGFAVWLARHPTKPAKVTAADFSTVAIGMGRQYAAEREIESIEWRVADITAIPFPDASFDTVVSCETIEHVLNPEQAVSELARVLRPGGRLYLTTPNYANPFGLYRLYLRAIGRPYQEAGQPINQFVMIHKTRRWVRNTGLSEVAWGTMDIVVPFPGRHPYHVGPVESRAPVLRSLGLQSYIVAEKGSDLPHAR